MKRLLTALGFLKKRFPIVRNQAPRRRNPDLTVESLERRDTPSTFLDVVTTPNYPTLGQFDALSVTVNGTSYQYAGIQGGIKLASSAAALPGNAFLVVRSQTRTEACRVRCSR